MITIGEFASLCKTSKKTIRYYEQIGLILPAYVNEHNGYRFYEESQIEVFLIISRLKWYGFSLQDIKQMLLNQKEPNLELIYNQILHLQQEMNEKASILRELESYSTNYERTGLLMPNPKFAIQEEQRKAIPIFEVRDTISMDHFGDLYGKLFSGNVAPRGPVGSIYYDELFDRDHADCGVFFVCKEDDANNMLPAGKYVSLMHQGPYHQLSETYNALVQYIKNHGFQIAGAPFELYLNNPEEVPVDQLETEVYFPVK